VVGQGGCTAAALVHVLELSQAEVAKRLDACIPEVEKELKRQHATYAEPAGTPGCCWHLKVVHRMLTKHYGAGRFVFRNCKVAQGRFEYDESKTYLVDGILNTSWVRGTRRLNDPEAAMGPYVEADWRHSVLIRGGHVHCLRLGRRSQEPLDGPVVRPSRP
jgi:hypothetical protein